MRRRFWLSSKIVGLGIGFACLAILSRNVGLRSSWSTLRRLNGPFLLVPVFVFLANLPLRAWRWLLIFPAPRPAFGACLTALGIGNMANFLLPGRAGDLARCLLVSRENSSGVRSRAAATIVVEKVFDGFAMMAMVVIALWVVHPPQWVKDLLWVAILVFGVALLFLVVASYHMAGFNRAVRRIFSGTQFSWLIEHIETFMSSFAEGLSAIRSLRGILVLVVFTAAIWITEGMLVWGLARVLGVPLTPGWAILATGILGLGLMIPAAPGGLGTYELFGTEAFKLVGISAGSALALTVVIHAWVFVANVALGVCMMAATGLSLGQLQRRTEASQK